MKYKIKIEIFDDVIEVNLTKIKYKKLYYDIIMLAVHYEGLSVDILNSVLNELDKQMKRHVITNKHYKQFYSDSTLKVSVKAL